MLSEQGIRPGSINMGRILRNLRYHTNQSKMVTYYRPPIYGKDSYGVETGVISAGNEEILLPDLPALIRPALTADYQLEKAGVNIIGAARAYTPNIKTIKGMSNFDQDNNTNFNEIEGWDRLITNHRTIYTVPTSGTSGWASSDGSTFTSDGQELTTTIASNASASISFTATANTLEADRIQFQIKATEAEGPANFEFFTVWHGSTSNDYRLLYDPVNIGFTADTWLTVDIPFITGTVASGTSVYQDGTRYDVPVTSGSLFDYEADFAKFAINYNAKTDDTIKIRNIQYYKAIEWHVHSLKEETDAYCIFNCVRTRGRRDSRRRAYG